MGLFRKATPEEFKPSVSSKTGKWIKDCFLWLIENEGHPPQDNMPVLWNEEFFPQTFRSKKIDANTLIQDICNILGIDTTKVSYKLVKDIRNIPGGPHSTSGRDIFGSSMDIVKDAAGNQQYELYFPYALLEHEEILLSRIILELAKVKCLEKKFADNPNELKAKLAHIISIFYGFGVILSKSLIHIGTSYTAGWQADWRYSSELKFEEFAYALAVYSMQLEDGDMSWSEYLAKDIRKLFEDTLEYIIEHPESTNFEEHLPATDAIQEKDYYATARKHYLNNNFEEAISAYEKAVSLTDNTETLATLYLNIGYTELRLQQYETSIPFFIKALEFNPSHGYAYDNMGFAYIMLGEYEKGRECLQQAIKTKTNHPAYSARNAAIYYMKKNDLELANQYFQKSFEANTPVDLLEYFYAQYLFLQSENEEAMNYLSQAVEKGEPEAISLMSEMK